MRGVVLCGGLGTRLAPLTKITNKHLLPVYNRPMVFYPIQTLVDAGITEIMVVTGGPYANHFLSVLKNGKELGIKKLSYAYQEGEGGIAEALSLAEEFADNEPIAVILGDNIFDDPTIADSIGKFSTGAEVFLKAVPDPERFGVAVLGEGNKILGIEEKPRHPKSTLAVSGLYLYDRRVFDFIKRCKPSRRGELEITDVNNQYIKHGQLQARELTGFWKDAGTFDTLLECSNYWSTR